MINSFVTTSIVYELISNLIPLLISYITNLSDWISLLSFFYYDDLISPNFQLSPEEADSRLHDLVSSTKDGNSLTSEKVASVTNDLENLAIFANDNEAVSVDQS